VPHQADAPRFAPSGTLWICGACGKTHTDQYGDEGEGSRGWDESCMLNAVLCHADEIKPGDRVRSARALTDEEIAALKEPSHE
jgi:hypothetical protein